MDTKKNCTAYNNVEGFPDAWMPCTTPAMNMGLCKYHFDSLIGIMIGSLSKGESRNVIIEKILASISDILRGD
jgi:hypothetical protein